VRTRKIGVGEEENERLEDLSKEDNDGASSCHSALAARSAFAHAVAVLALFGWIAIPPSAHVGAGASDHTLHASFHHLACQPMNPAMEVGYLQTPNIPFKLLCIQA